MHRGSRGRCEAGEKNGGAKRSPLNIMKSEERKRTETVGWNVSGTKRKERKKKISSSFFLFAELLWQRERQGQQDQSFKCSSVLAELCVSALCGSTKFCRPAQHGDSDKKKKNSRAHQNPFTPLVHIYPTSLRSDVLYSLAQFSQAYILQCHEECISKPCLGCHAFSGFWAILKRTVHRNILGDHCNICLIHIWSATHVHLLTLDIFCGMTKNRGEGKK